MDAVVLAALAEPNRLRIVELLGVAPRPVGEIGTALALRQPQVTKHLQTLLGSGLVRVHRLGKRRIYALRREPLRELAAWSAAMAADHSSEQALIRYERAITAETKRQPTRPLSVQVRRTVPASPRAVWAAWTEAEQVRRWWSPQHFRVAACTVDAVPGGELAIVLQEGDGTRHHSRGHFTRLLPVERLAFELSPEDERGRPLFRVTHTVRLQPAGERTTVTLRARATDAVPEAAPALAGLRIGWEQLLDNLIAHLS